MIRNGYLNKVIIKKKYKKEFNNPSGLYNEKLIYDKLNIKYSINKNILTREVFPGEIVKKWDEKKLESLKYEIKKFQSISIDGLKKHDWKKYIKNSYVLNEKQLNDFNIILNIIPKELVASHNDINNHNVLWNGENIRLIDFEWATLNHPYFDYINFYIHENILIKGDFDKNTWNDLLYLTLCFFLMWSENHKDSKYVKSLKIKYLNMLNGI